MMITIVIPPAACSHLRNEPLTSIKELCRTVRKQPALVRI